MHRPKLRGPCHMSTRNSSGYTSAALFPPSLRVLCAQKAAVYASRGSSARARKPSPPRTDGKRASSTRCPVNSGVLASSLAATGRGDRTGHVCSILYFCTRGTRDDQVKDPEVKRSVDSGKSG